MFGQKKDKGILFTTDAMFAGLIIVIAMISLSQNFVHEDKTPDLSYMSYDIVKGFSSIKTYEINNSYMKEIIASGVVENLNNTLLETIGELYVLNKTVEAENLARNISAELIPGNYGFSISINDELVYTNGKPVGQKVMTAKRLISGIERYKPIRGSTSKVYLEGLEEKKDSSYIFFGGFIGQGNISDFTDDIPIDANITNIYAEIEIGNDIGDIFNIYFNNVKCGINLTKKSGVMTADSWNLSTCKNSVIPGVRNNISIIPLGSLDTAYLSGGFVRFDYKTKQMYDPAPEGYTKFYFPSIDGLINIYSSTYIPGDITDMSVCVKYFVDHTNSSNSTFYLKIGNSTVFTDTSSTTTTIQCLDGSVLGSLGMNYSFLSTKNIPIRMGAENVSYFVEYLGSADAVISTDISGSMGYEMNSGNDGVTRNCTDPHINDSDTNRLSVAKCLDKTFATNMLNVSGNKIGLVSYSTTTDKTLNLSNNITLVTSNINNYSTILWTCICCGINSATNILSIGINRTVLVANGSVWSFTNTSFNGTPKNDASNNSWYNFTYANESSWKTGNATLGHIFGNPNINTDMGGGIIFLNYSHPVMWENSSDLSSPEADFTHGWNSTANTFGLGRGDDGWDWNGSGTLITITNVSADLENSTIFLQLNNTVGKYVSSLVLPSSNLSIGKGWINASNMYGPGITFGNGTASYRNNSWYGFNTNIPLDNLTSSTVINGLLVNSNCSVNPSTGTNTFYIQLSNNNGTSWSPTVDDTGDIGTAYTLRNNTNGLVELWGLTWNASSANNARVKLVTNVDSSHLSNQIRCDFIKMQINYSLFPNNQIDINGSVRNYSGVLTGVLPSSSLENITVTVNINAYNSSASSANNGTLPLLLLKMYNGTGFEYIGNMTPIGSGNISKIITNSNILSAWSSQSNRNLSLQIAYMDDNSIIKDVLNYSAVWVSIVSSQTNFTVNFSGPTNGVLKLNFSTGSPSQNRCSNYDCQGFYGVDVDITPALYAVINASNGKFILEFNYEWESSPANPFSSIVDEVWIKSRWISPNSGEHYLGSEISNVDGDNTLEVANQNNPDTEFSGFFSTNIKDYVEGPGHYYLDFGAKLNADSSSKWGAAKFDNVSLKASNTTETYYLRKHFNITNLNSLSKIFMNLMSDNSAKVYLNGVLVFSDNTVNNATYWNTVGHQIANSYFREGENVFAVELFTSSEFSRFNMELFRINDSRNKAMLLMTDGQANRECSEQGVTADLDNDDTADTSMDDAIQASCDARRNWGISVYAVGYSSDADESTLQGIADCGGGMYLRSNDTAVLSNFYDDVAAEIMDVSRVEQKIVVTGSPTLSKLYGQESYIEINYTSPIHAPEIGEISANFENRGILNCTLYSNISSKLRLVDSKVSSYSSSKWTDYLFVNNATTHNLSWFNSDYQFLGDPYIVGFSPLLLNYDKINNITIRTGIEPVNSTGCSPNDTFFYTGLMKSTISYSEVLEYAIGCNWNVQFEDNSVSTLKVPQNYLGSNNCSYKSSGIIYNVNDTYDDAVYKLLNNLDLNSNGKIDVNLVENNLVIGAISVNKVPYPWGPAIAEVRIWQ